MGTLFCLKRIPRFKKVGKGGKSAFWWPFDGEWKRAPSKVGQVTNPTFGDKKGHGGWINWKEDIVLFFWKKRKKHFSWLENWKGLTFFLQYFHQPGNEETIYEHTQQTYIYIYCKYIFFEDSPDDIFIRSFYHIVPWTRAFFHIRDMNSVFWGAELLHSCISQTLNVCSIYLYIWVV